MGVTRSRRKDTDDWLCRSSTDFNIALGLIGVAVVISVTYLAYNWGYVSGHDELEVVYRSSGQPTITASGIYYPHILNAWRLNITGALIISIICLWSRKRLGVILSSLMLIWSGFIYLWWYINSLAYLRGAEVSSYDQIITNFPHVGGLRGATWFDITVLILVVISFAWHLRILLRLKS